MDLYYKVTLQEVKKYLDSHYKLNVYNLVWNYGRSAGQHIPHALLHVFPRYDNEPLAGKGIRYIFKGELLHFSTISQLCTVITFTARTQLLQ
ncbi:HIT family protein [Lysinibacillus fusiformis]|uniref:HIT family protein n=1 Tax=Lysinibacillus fusiformis TaxID=28031 RepID=UPI0030B81AE9